MPRRLIQLLVATTLIFVIGLHWVILQSVAWTGMIIVYSQTAPLLDAVEKTFDGKHPCKICKAVDEGKKAEKKQPSRKLTTKLDFFCNPELLAVLPPAPFSLPIAKLKHSFTWTEAPPGPPPRLV
jgi:hypothetical protein